jgi:exodeoxyribonuclease VII small subunit
VNFSRAFEELERIVAAFETGVVDLERDLPKFERGLQLAVACRARLQEIDNHIRTIEKTFLADDAARPAVPGKGQERSE